MPREVAAALQGGRIGRDLRPMRGDGLMVIVPGIRSLPSR